MVSISSGLKRAGLVFLAASLVVVTISWYIAIRRPAIQRRVLRIGFENVPPVQVRTGNGFAGLAVDIVNDAANRAGVKLQWVETGTSSEEALRRGLVDLWPLMADLPDRRQRVHITRPYLHTTHTLMLREGSAMPDRTFSGRIALLKMPLHVRLASGAFPNAQLVQFEDISEILKDVCIGTVAAAFLEDRAALSALREKPSQCGSQQLRAEALPALTLQLGIGSTFQSSVAADKIRDKIGDLFRDGTLAATIIKYSYYGLDDTWTTYALLEDAERARWMAWGISGLALVLALFLWRLGSLRQRKRSETELRKSEALFRAIVSQAAVGIARISIEGTWQLVNQRYCEMLGYSEAELMSKTLRDITHPDDLEESSTARRRLLEREISAHTMEKRYIRKDGSIVWASLYRSLVRDQDGTPQYFICVIEDISERKQAQAELRESEERFRKVFEDGPLGLALVAKGDRFLKVNTAMCRILGYSETELLEMSFLDITHPDDLSPNAELAWRLSKNEASSYNLQKRYMRKNGETIWVKLTASTIHDEKGEPHYALAMIEDITELKRTQEETLARQKLESVGVLASGIAHDFNNILGGILAQAELIEQELPTAAPCEEIRKIKTSVIRGSEIVRELLIYSGRDTPDSEAVSVSRLVEEMLELLKVSISKHATLEFDLGKNLPAVWGHAPQIRQIVMNLVINASEAIGDGGVVKVTTSLFRQSQAALSNASMSLAKGEHILLEVSDTGSGMDEEVKAKIFDPFFTTKFAGRGLGLAVVQGIVRAHSGVIDLVSAPGEGTTFYVLLPCSSVCFADVGGVAPSANAERSKLGVGTVLVVEDEETLRRAVSKTLRKRGLTVMEASDGSVAMNLLHAQSDGLEAILLDATLPGMSSREILEETRRIRPDLKVIVTSAYSKDMVDASFTGLKVDRFIRKPFTLDDIVHALEATD